MKKPLTAIPYFGGKTPYVNWLYTLFPKEVHLVDAMCGSATVAINANAKDFPLITINDLNSDVINFFEVLRNQYDKFIHLIKYTPFSREEFYKAAFACEDPLERARRFFIRALQGYAGMGSQNDEKGWGYELSVQSATGRSYNHFRVTTWNNKLDYLNIIADRLKNMQVENRSVIEIIKQYNRPGILIYVDPPYLKRVRTDKKRYRHEFTDQDHIDMAYELSLCESFVAVSGYDDPFYDSLFPGWVKNRAPGKMQNTAKKLRHECLWTNYDPSTINKLTLF